MYRNLVLIFSRRPLHLYLVPVIICISIALHLLLCICLCLYITKILLLMVAQTVECLQCRRSGFDPWVRKILQGMKRQSTPVFLPGEFHGQRSLAAYCHEVTKSDTTERLTLKDLHLLICICLKVENSQNIFYH